MEKKADSVKQLITRLYVEQPHLSNDFMFSKTKKTLVRFIQQLSSCTQTGISPGGEMFGGTILLQCRGTIMV